MPTADKSWIIILLCAIAVLFGLSTLLQEGSNDNIGYAINLYQNFSPTINSFNSPNLLNFSSTDNNKPVTFSISDDAVYMTAWISINGTAWQPITLTGTTLSGNWLQQTTTGLYTIARTNIPNGTGTDNYIITYSCTKNTTTNPITWNCHNNKWQIKTFNTTKNDNTNTTGNTSTLKWTDELMTNGGFETGNLNGWTTSTSYWSVGSEVTNGLAGVQSGSYCAYTNRSSDSAGYIYQDVDLSSYISYIDSGNAVVNASGWGVSSESPGQDLSRIQIFFLNSAKGIIQTAADSGVVDNPTWWKEEINNYAIPNGARYIRMWGNTYEQGYSSGSLDSFSVKVGYGGAPIIPPTCTSHSYSRCDSSTNDVYWFNSCNAIEDVKTYCNNTQTCSSNACVNNAVSPICGDGICNNNETCSSCPGDCGTCTSTGTTYYISATIGSDSTGDGTLAKPWKTLYKACSTVTKSGSVIHVNAGTYTETSQCQLAVGVSIEGEHTNPLTSIIVSTYAASLDNQYDASILLLSPSSSATDGDQSINYIKLDGNNLAGKRGITVRFRNYVSIHDCTISNFDYSGVYFSGTTNGYPTITSSRYDHDNSIYNCNIINNAHGMDGSGIFGDLLYDAQQDFLIHNNIFDQTERWAGNNGDTLNGVYSKGLKMYNNTFYRNDNEGSEWNFFSEIFFTAGGEIYNNTFHGLATLDVVDVRKGAYAFGVKIYDNQFLVNTQVPETYHGIQAIDFEEVGQVQYVYVYNNHFKNSNTAVQFDATGTTHYKTPVNGVISMDHLYVYYNIFENMGATDNKDYAAIVMKPESVNAPYKIVWNQIYIDNNVILSGSTYQTWCGIEWQQGGDYSNLYIRNNIIRGSSQYPIIFYDGGATVPGTQTNINIQNNLYYQNGANQLGYDGTIANEITGLTQYTPTPADPLFTSSTDFHLKAGSPAINNGTYSGLTSTDYDGKTVNNPPDIGAYEYP